MKTKLFCILFLGCCMMACEKNEPSPKISGTASVLSSSGRTSCEWVQLWKNGPKWATFNVGATIIDYANLTIGADSTAFHNYTEMAPYYNTANVGGLYPWNNPGLNGRKTTWDENVTTGISDVAATLWGSNWKTPTREQLDTLCDEGNNYGKTTWTWCDGDSVQYVKGCTLKGYKVSGVGNYAQYSIFFPATGFYHFYSILVYNAGNFGGYRSSVLHDDPSGAYYMYFYSDSRGVDYGSFELGLSVRAILAE